MFEHIQPLTQRSLNNGNPLWQDLPDWEPQQQSYLCACGCGEVVIWQGKGRKPRYIEGHRQRVYWRKWHGKG